MSNSIKILFIVFSLVIVLSVCSFALNVFTDQKEVIDIGQSKIDEITMSYHNIPFMPYESDTVYYADIKKMISLIIANNRNAQYLAYRISLQVNDENYGEITTQEIYDICDYLNPNAINLNTIAYAVTLYYNDNGMIGKIIIKTRGR